MRCTSEWPLKLRTITDRLCFLLGKYDHPHFTMIPEDLWQAHLLWLCWISKLGYRCFGKPTPDRHIALAKHPPNFNVIQWPQFPKLCVHSDCQFSLMPFRVFEWWQTTSLPNASHYTAPNDDDMAYCHCACEIYLCFWPMIGVISYIQLPPGSPTRHKMWAASLTTQISSKWGRSDTAVNLWVAEHQGHQ